MGSPAPWPQPIPSAFPFFSSGHLVTAEKAWCRPQSSMSAQQASTHLLNDDKSSKAVLQLGITGLGSGMSACTAPTCILQLASPVVCPAANQEAASLLLRSEDQHEVQIAPPGSRTLCLSSSDVPDSEDEAYVLPSESKGENMAYHSLPQTPVPEATGCKEQVVDCDSVEVILSSAEVSDAHEETGETSSIHEDLEMRILTERLKLLTTQRQLAAQHCQNFTDMLEASLKSGADGQVNTANRLSVQRTAAHRQQSLEPRFSPSSSLKVPRTSTGSHCRSASMCQPAFSSSPQRHSPHPLAKQVQAPAPAEDDEAYWSSPNFYRGKHRGAYPVPNFHKALGARMPPDAYFMDPQKPRKKPPNRHFRNSTRFQREAHTESVSFRS